ncbi:MAG: DNA N-6-adenine-methyltransferase, partial [Actinomycetota bacterium]|nr:DNA N-6-adenine-methyltransferase [Actinomycetota bacterium]
DGLKQSWQREMVFVNPPYSKVKDWVKKAYEESQNEAWVVLKILFPIFHLPNSRGNCFQSTR